MSPNFRRSSGSTWRRRAGSWGSNRRPEALANPMGWEFSRRATIWGSPSNAPPTMNRTFRGVERDEVLLGVLAAALRRDAADGPLEHLQERLLHALARDVARDARVVALPRDLVDLVEVDDPALRPLHVVVGRLEEVAEDALDVLPHVPGLGEGGGVGDGERDVEDPGEGLRQQRLPRPGRPEEEDVGLLELDLVVVEEVLLRVEPLVVVVDGDGERPLGPALADDVLVEGPLDLGTG
jgi:hypothetical protein